MNKPDLADVLVEVNRVRAEHGITPVLTEMPKGMSMADHQYEGSEITSQCPIALAIDGAATHAWLAPNASSYEVAAARFGNRGQTIADLRETLLDPPTGIVPTPPVIRDFIFAHDRGLYPELVA